MNLRKFIKNSPNGGLAISFSTSLLLSSCQRKNNFVSNKEFLDFTEDLLEEWCC